MLVIQLNFDTMTRINILKTNYKLMAVLCLFMLQGCEDMFIGPQPNFLEDSVLEPKLNVMGILRPDSIGNLPMSFIHLEKSVSLPYDTNETQELKNAQVIIYKMDGQQIIDSLDLVYTDFNSEEMSYAYRSDSLFPMSGETYRLLCKFGNLPELSSETTIPPVPKLVNDTVIIRNNSAVFSIERDSNIKLYDIYIIVEEDKVYYTRRILRPETGNIKAEIFYNREEFEGLDSVDLIIYGYDNKLSEYLTNTPSAIWPNTYHPAYSTVNNGYGCFGSINIRKKKIRL